MTHLGKLDRMAAQHRAYNRFITFIISGIALCAVGALGAVYVFIHFVTKFW